MLTTLALLTAPFLTSVLGDENDLVVLKDGKSIDCRVLLETDETLFYRVKGKTKEAAMGDVSEVQSVERSLSEFLDRFATLNPNDVGDLEGLARFAEERQLSGEARHTWIRVLTLDANHETAWMQLGGSKRRSGWQLKVRGRFYSIEELRKRVSDWKNALELPTAHFLLRTDAPPERAVDVAIDLERAWRTFYDVLGKPLSLYVFDEQPEINVYSDPKDYPAPPTAGMAAWFARGANTLHVNATEKQDSGTIVAELVDALVFNAFRRTLGKTGDIEPWAKKGLAYAFGTAVRPSPGRVEFDFSAPFTDYFQAQARDEKPLSLTKVLRAGFTSFDSGSDALRYMSQSYTLVHFLVFYQDGKYRVGFADFLRHAYLGKGGTSNFFQAVGVKEDILQGEWDEYVKSVAGV